jgi:hypothetical protein
MQIVYKVSCVAAQGQTQIAQNGAELDEILNHLHSELYMKDQNSYALLASVPFSKFVKVEVAVMM